MGLIHKALVVGVLLLALPTPARKGVESRHAGADLQPSTFAAFTAAADAIADMKGFCDRRPQACIIGQSLGRTLEAKVRYGAQMVFDWAHQQDGPEPQKARASQGAPQPEPAPNAHARPRSIEDLLHGD